ncbi:MAG: glycosyltransferase family 39 protein [Actinomycetota bacterium]|nr:glycosyltransferase family 39 protein [Actinomycetota bacterium]
MPPLDGLSLSAVTAPSRARPRTTLGRLRAGAGGQGRRLRRLAGHPVVLATGLMALSTFLRTWSIGAGFWIDEGITVGIASSPFTEIPTVLRQDGAPPLFYLMLSVWMEIVGNGEARIHALSLGFAVLTVPAALWAGRSLFDARTGWMAAVIAAVHPFLTFYANEARMYSLLTLLTLLLGAVFVHAFVNRRRGYLPLFAMLLTMLLYTHNWALFVGAGAVAALAPVWQASGDRRGLLRDAALAFGGAAVLYAPWIPSLVFQALHTGAPWATVPTFGELATGVGSALGGMVSGLAILLVGGAGFAAILEARGDGDPARRRRCTAALALLVLAGGTVLVAWLASQVSPAWAERYTAVAVGPAILLAAVGLAHARRQGLVTLAMLVFLWFNPLVVLIEGKDNTRKVTTSLEYRARGAGRPRGLHPPRTHPVAVLLPWRRVPLRDLYGAGRRPARVRLARRAGAPRGRQAHGYRRSVDRELADRPGAHPRPAHHQHLSLVARAVDRAGAPAGRPVGGGPRRRPTPAALRNPARVRPRAPAPRHPHGHLPQALGPVSSRLGERDPGPSTRKDVGMSIVDAPAGGRGSDREARTDRP